jgi:hypothetical protein
MTTDEFDRILTSLKHTGGMNIIPLGVVIPYRAVIEILHSNLHPEDKTRYVFDWTKNEVRKKDE